MNFNQQTAEAHLNKLLAQYNIKVLSWSKSSCGYAYWDGRGIKIPQPTNVDRFGVCMHEIHHVIEGNVGKRFEQEFNCDMYALKQIELLGFDSYSWKLRTRWHVLSRIAMATNRGLSVDKIPQQIKTYFSDIRFNNWQGKKVFVSCKRDWTGLTISIKEKSKYVASEYVEEDVIWQTH